MCNNNVAYLYLGMAHLRSPLHDLPWYQQSLLDVVAFVLVVVTLQAFVTLSCFRFCFRKIQVYADQCGYCFRVIQDYADQHGKCFCVIQDYAGQQGYCFRIIQDYTDQRGYCLRII